MTRTVVITAALAFASTLSITPVQAEVARTFVSAAGSDSNNCANVASPCRHFATAFVATAPGGEIFVLDPANYGSLTITHAVSIEGHGWASVAPAINGNAITVNAGPTDVISIHGVAINGTGVAGGTNGIVFNSGGSLTIIDCVVQNFIYDGSHPTTGNGILLTPNSATINLVVANTTISGNGNIGLYYLPQSGASIVPTTVTIDHIVAINNQYGIVIDGSNLGISSVIGAISSSAADNNNNTGIAIGSGSQASLRISIDSIEASNNTNYGVTVGGTAKVLLGRSVITGNSASGTVNDTVPNTFYSYGNNQINLNGGGDIGGSLNTAFIPR